VKLLTSLMLDRIWIALQPVDVPFEQVIFALEAMQLVVQNLRLLTLLLICRQTILAKDYVIAHRQRERGSSSGCDLAPTELNAIDHTQEGLGMPLILEAFASCGQTIHRTSQYKFVEVRRQVENFFGEETYLVCTDIFGG
jgi:hypothetical protein